MSAVDGDFLACGSESSELYVYYKALSKPVAQQAFAALGEVGSALESQVGGRWAKGGGLFWCTGRAVLLLVWWSGCCALSLCCPPDRLLPHSLSAWPAMPAPQSDKAFISAVCWRPGAQTLLAANSMGTVKVFSLTGSSSQLL